MGDDYGAITLYNHAADNWLDNTLHSLLNTSRYTQSISSSVLYWAFGENIGKLLPLTIYVWIVVLIYQYTSLNIKSLGLKKLNWQLLFISISFASFMIIFGSPREAWHVTLFYQTFFFSSAIVTYTLSILSLLTLMLIYLRKPKFIKKHPIAALVVFFLVSFITNLWNEVLPATVFGVSFLLFLSTLFKHKIKKLPYITYYYLASMVSSLLALSVMYLSPARLARSDSLAITTNYNLFEVVSTKYIDFLEIYAGKLDFFLLVILALASSLFILNANNKSDKILSSSKKLIFYGLLLSAAAALSMLISVILLTLGYGPATTILTRALSPGHILLFSGMVVLLTGLFTYLNKKYTTHNTQVLLLVVVLILTIYAIPKMLDRSYYIVTYTGNYYELWNSVNNDLSNAKNKDSTQYVPREFSGIGDGFSLSCKEDAVYTNWLNEGIEEYYDLDSICSIED